MPQYPVFLNVYDMYWINSYTFNIGLGVFHSGVVIHGKEYAYGGHPYEWSGIFDMFPRSSDHLGPEFKFRESIKLGITEITEEELNDIVREMGARYTGVSYHLIDKNCNHFTSELSQVLCGKDIPGWVNRLANAGSYFPFLLKCLPKEWIRPEPESPTSPLFVNGSAFRELSGSDDEARIDNNKR
ncbi:deubiquitinase DESI2-like [Actinia tenebrosa]|uniref:Deubiquitinase DESI2-like n=1 Tax=Actinia tenebrosa TaxID=6105 RepID=A0A6P8J240_ACTTE|nr:deubiquitinase DESI2-like [Actinia tenebrosa]